MVNMTYVLSPDSSSLERYQAHGLVKRIMMCPPDIIFTKIKEIIKNCRMMSKVLIMSLFPPRQDLLPNNPLQETIRVANANMSKLCVQSERVEILDISRIGQQLFTYHGQHLRESGKRLLKGLMAAHLAYMASDPHRHNTTLVTAPRHLLPTVLSRTEGEPNPDLYEMPKQLRMLLFETFDDSIKSTGHQHHIILDKQRF
ncbi:hypothetical protein J6590_044514 [Homalodisca vitripennis]|nr:hypothetical protein J6590_044514 [Homalodisca vitripennis]